jgi:hypothetical protein
VKRLSKAWKQVPANIIPRLFLKFCLSDVEDGIQDGIPWDDSKQILCLNKIKI